MLIPAICKNRPDWFAEIYLKNDVSLKIPDFHRDIYKLFENKTETRVALKAPVGHGKSTCVSFACPTWAICYKKYKEIMVISATASFAEKWLRKIRQEIITNEDIKRDFGISQGDEWRDNESTFSNGVRLVAKGKGAMVTGYRSDVFIVDDLETEAEARSELERARLKEWWYLTLLNRPKADTGRIFVVGSVSSKLAFINNLCTEEAKQAGWTTRTYSQKLSATIWPELWSNEALEKKKLELSAMPGVFEALFQGDTGSFLKYAFKTEWVRYYNELPKNLRIFTAVDPAAGGDCFTAIVTGGIDPATGTIYIIDIIKRNFNVQTLEMFGSMFMVYDLYRPLKFGIEATVFGKYLKPFFEKECRERGKTPNVVEIKRDNKESKDFRIRSLAHWFEEGKILIPATKGAGMVHLLSELEAYPECATIDVLDALSMLVNDLMTPGTISVNTGTKPQLYQRKKYGI